MPTPSLLLVALVASALDGSPATERLVRGEAFDLETGVPVFVEEHRERWRAGRPIATHVTFRRPSGELLAEKWIVHRERPETPAFESIDARTGGREAALPGGDRIELAWQPDDRSRVRRESTDLAQITVVDAGIYRFIDGNWDRLIAGESLPLEMAVPSRLGFVSFRLSRVEVDQATDPGGEAVTFELTAASFLVRLALDPLRFSYSTRDRRLLEFRGRTGLVDDDGRPIHARELFTGGAPGVRPTARP